MKRVFKNHEIVILSDKSIVADDGRLLTFEDGSLVDVPSRKIINKGIGEIVIKDLPLWPAMLEILRDQQTFIGINHLIVSGDMNNIVITPDDGVNCIVSSGGADAFVQKVLIHQQYDRLYIETPRSESNIQVRTRIMVNGKRIPSKLDDNFGYIEVGCKNLKSLYVNGYEGNIYSYVPICELKAEIKGITSIDATLIENMDVKISGSGSVSVNQLSGKIHGKISGSGNIDIQNGEVDNINIDVSGSGSLCAGVTAQTANLSLSGSGTIIIAQVVNECIEQKTGSGFLKVLKRG